MNGRCDKVVLIIEDVFTLSEGFHDKREGDEAEEEHVKLVKPGEDSSEGFQAAEQPLSLVTFAVQLPVVLPGGSVVPFRRHYRCEPQCQGQPAEQAASFRGITGLSGG